MIDMTSMVDDYLATRHALGYKLEVHRLVLYPFVTHMAAIGAEHIDRRRRAPLGSTTIRRPGMDHRQAQHHQGVRPLPHRVRSGDRGPAGRPATRTEPSDRPAHLLR